MADENSFVQEVKFKVDDSELRAAINMMRNAFGNGVDAKITGGLEKGLKKAGKEAKNVAKETDKIAKSTKNAKKETDALTKSFDKMTGAVKGLVAAYAGFKGVSALVGFGQGSIAAFSAQKRAELQLDTVLKNRGLGFASGYIKNAASEIQQRTTIGDESMIAGAAELATYVKDPKQLKRMMGLLADYSMGMTGGAELSPESLTNLATGLGKAFDGSYEAMRKKGFDTSELEMITNALKLKEDLEKGNIKTDKNTGELKLSNDDKELLKWLKENRGKNIEDLKITALENAMKDWKGLADEFANTDEGRIQQLKNTIGDMREEIGRQLLPVVAELAGKLRENLPTLNALFNGMKNVLVSIMTSIKQHWGVLTGFVNTITGLLTVIAKYLPEIVAFAGTMKVVGALMPVLSGGLTAIKVAATSLVAGNALGLVAGGLMALVATTLTLRQKLMEERKDERLAAGNKTVEEIQKIKSTKWRDKGYEQGKALEQHKKLEEQIVAYARVHDGAVPQEWLDAYKSYLTDYEGKKAEGTLKYRVGNKWQAVRGEKSSGPSLGVNFESEYKKAMEAVEKETKGATTINNINYTNNITTDSDLMAKMVKENLRTLLTSQLTFVSRSETARALAL